MVPEGQVGNKARCLLAAVSLTSVKNLFMKQPLAQPA